MMVMVMMMVVMLTKAMSVGDGLRLCRCSRPREQQRVRVGDQEVDDVRRPYARRIRRLDLLSGELAIDHVR